MKSELIFFLVFFISLQIPHALSVRAKDSFALNSGKEGLHIFADYHFYLFGEKPSYLLGTDFNSIGYDI